MGVYVMGMKMPEYCLLCPFEHLMECSRAERFTDIHERRRPEWCPLIEVPNNAFIIAPGHDYIVAEKEAQRDR